MTKILTSKWFAAGIAIVAFAGTMAFLWKPAAPAKQPKKQPETTETKPTEAPPSKPTALDEAATKPIVKPAPDTSVLPSQVGEPGSLRFNNPEVNKLVEELLEEKRQLRERDEALQQWARRLAAEREAIGTITNEVLKTKEELQLMLTNQLNLRVLNEETNLLHLARAYTNMSPATATMILNGMDVGLVARILMKMGDPNRAAILENFMTNSAIQAEGKATLISDKIRLYSEPPKPLKK